MHSQLLLSHHPYTSFNLPPPPKESHSSHRPQAALEVGGGPWFDTWIGRAQAQEPIRTMLTLPLDPSAAANLLPPILRPPGL